MASCSRAVSFRRSETFCASHDLVEFLQKFDLLVDQQFRITYHVD